MRFSDHWNRWCRSFRDSYCCVKRPFLLSPAGHPERSHLHSRCCKPYWWTLRSQQESEAEREPHSSHHESIWPLLHPGGRLQWGTPLVLSKRSCTDYWSFKGLALKDYSVRIPGDRLRHRQTDRWPAFSRRGVCGQTLHPGWDPQISALRAAVQAQGAHLSELSQAWHAWSLY